MASVKRQILLVDDDLAAINLTLRLLTDGGYEVTPLRTIGAALNALRHMPLLPDLIISDINIKTHSGFEFLKIVKKDPGFAAIPFMFLTTSCRSESARQTAALLGANKLLSRPIESRVLLNEIAALIDKAA